MVCRRLVTWRAAAALLVGGVLLVPETLSAGPHQGDPNGERREGSATSAQVSIDIDVQTADDTTLEGAVDDIRENVTAQRTALEDAQQAVTDAEADLLTKTAEVMETQEEIDVLVLLSDDVVARAFVSPPSHNAVDLLDTDSVVDTAVKQTLLGIQATEDADVLSMLADKREEMEVLKAEQEDALTAAEAASEAAVLALADLEAAVSQQVTFAIEIERRIERGLTETETLSEIDPELAQELSQQQEDLAKLIEQLQTEAETEAALADAGIPPAQGNEVDGSSVIEPVGGGVANVSCPSGGSIQVAGDISRNVQSLLNLSSQQGLTMCGTGWRDPQQQINLRRQNCGPSEYQTYQAPSSACSPPTARPGTSMHERGLAIDFTCGSGAVRSGDACFAFLSNNAATYGLYNLPSEPWHWSTDGL